MATNPFEEAPAPRPHFCPRNKRERRLDQSKFQSPASVPTSEKPTANFLFALGRNKLDTVLPSCIPNRSTLAWQKRKKKNAAINRRGGGSRMNMAENVTPPSEELGASFQVVALPLGEAVELEAGHVEQGLEFLCR